MPRTLTPPPTPPPVKIGSLSFLSQRLPVAWKQSKTSLLFFRLADQVPSLEPREIVDARYQ